MRANNETAPLVSQTDNQQETDDPSNTGDVFYDAVTNPNNSFGITTGMSVRSSWWKGVPKSELAYSNALFLLRDSIVFSTKTVIMDQGGYNQFLYADSPWKSRVSAFCRQVLTWNHESWKRFVFWFGSVGLIVLSFIEPPSWCANEEFHFNTTHIYNSLESNKGACEAVLTYKGPVPGGDPNEIVLYYPTWDIALFSASASLYLLKFSLFLLIVDILLHFGKNGMCLGTFFYITESKGMNAIDRMAKMNIGLSKKYTMMARIIRFTQVISVFMLIVETIASEKFGWLRDWSPLWRALIFASYSEGVQREVMSVSRLLPGLFSALLVLVIVEFFYAWIGVIAFNGAMESFNSLPEAMWTLWICVTTANYPDVMMPIYNNHRFVAFYFVSFMMITYFFIMNVILGGVVNSYKEENDSVNTAMAEISETYLKSAFILLQTSNDGSIDRDFMKIVLKDLIKQFPDLGKISLDKSEDMFAKLDVDQSGEINVNEFMEFGSVLFEKFEEASDNITFVQQHFPTIYHSESFQKFSNRVKSRSFDIFVDVVLILNAIVVGLQSYPDLSGQGHSKSLAERQLLSPYEVLETVFTAFYCFEMLFKIIVYGWKKYISDGRNVFDAFVTVLVMVATFIVYYPNNINSHLIIRFAVMIRVLRLARLLTALKQFEIIGNTFMVIIPAAKRIAKFMFFVMYLVTSMGIAFFGGLVTRDPSNPNTAKLEQTAFGSGDYWANNFNDYPSGFNSLFNLLVVNNWIILAAGLEEVTGHKWWTRLFFFAFHIIGVVVVNNIVVAFIIDSFMDEMATSGKKEVSDEETTPDSDTTLPENTGVV